MSKNNPLIIRIISIIALAGFMLAQAGSSYALDNSHLRQETVESDTAGNAVGAIGKALDAADEQSTAGAGGKRTEEKAIAFIKERYGGVGSSDSGDWLNSPYGAETREIMAAITRAELPPWGTLIEKAGYEPSKRKRPVSLRERALHQIAKIVGFGRPYRGQDVIDYRKAHNIPWVLTAVWWSDEETDERKKTVLVYRFPTQRHSDIIVIETKSRNPQVLERGEAQLREMGYRPVETIKEAEELGRAIAARSRQAIKQIRAAQTASRGAARERVKAAAGADTAQADASGVPWIDELNELNILKDGFKGESDERLKDIAVNREGKDAARMAAAAVLALAERPGFVDNIIPVAEDALEHEDGNLLSITELALSRLNYPKPIELLQRIALECIKKNDKATARLTAILAVGIIGGRDQQCRADAREALNYLRIQGINYNDCRVIQMTAVAFKLLGINIRHRLEYKLRYTDSAMPFYRIADSLTQEIVDRIDAPEAKDQYVRIFLQSVLMLEIHRMVSDVVIVVSDAGFEFTPNRTEGPRQPSEPPIEEPPRPVEKVEDRIMSALEQIKKFIPVDIRISLDGYWYLRRLGDEESYAKLEGASCPLDLASFLEKRKCDGIYVSPRFIFLEEHLPSLKRALSLAGVARMSDILSGQEDSSALCTDSKIGGDLVFYAATKNTDGSFSIGLKTLAEAQKQIRSAVGAGRQIRMVDVTAAAAAGAQAGGSPAPKKPGIQKLSREDIDALLSTLSEDQRIKHDKIGIGTIKEIDRENGFIYVAFDCDAKKKDRVRQLDVGYAGRYLSPPTADEDPKLKNWQKLTGTEGGQLGIPEYNARRYGALLTLDFGGVILPRWKNLTERLGIPPEKIRQYTKLLLADFEKSILPRWQSIRDELGIPEEKIRQYPELLTLNFEKNILPTWQALTVKLGIPEEKIRQYPELLSLSLEINIYPTCYYLLNVASFLPNYIIGTPIVLTHSLIDRLSPRTLFLQLNGKEVSVTAFLESPPKFTDRLVQSGFSQASYEAFKKEYHEKAGVFAEIESAAQEALKGSDAQTKKSVKIAFIWLRIRCDEYAISKKQGMVQKTAEVAQQIEALEDEIIGYLPPDTSNIDSIRQSLEIAVPNCFAYETLSEAAAVGAGTAAAVAGAQAEAGAAGAFEEKFAKSNFAEAGFADLQQAGVGRILNLADMSNATPVALAILDARITMQIGHRQPFILLVNDTEARDRLLSLKIKGIEQRDIVVISDYKDIDEALTEAVRLIEDVSVRIEYYHEGVTETSLRTIRGVLVQELPIPEINDIKTLADAIKQLGVFVPSGVSQKEFEVYQAARALATGV